MVEGKVHVKLLTVYLSTEWNSRPSIAINHSYSDIFNQLMVRDVTSLLLYGLHVARYCIIVLIWLEMHKISLHGNNNANSSLCTTHRGRYVHRKTHCKQCNIMRGEGGGQSL